MFMTQGQKSAFHLIRRHLDVIPSRSYPRVVGINGVDTSGKTCFTSFLADYLIGQGLEVCLIRMDDFHNPSSLRNQGPNPIDAYLSNAFNLEFLETELLVPMCQEGRLEKTLQLLDLETDTYTLTRHYQIQPHSVVLIEGVLLYRPPIDRYFDLRVFLEIPFDEVLRRAEMRDVPLYGEAFLERYRAKYIPLQQRYLREFGPSERSDILIDNTDYENPTIIRSRVMS